MKKFLTIKNVAITKTRVMNKEGQDISGDTVDILVWPKFFEEDSKLFQNHEDEIQLLLEKVHEKWDIR